MLLITKEELEKEHGPISDELIGQIRILMARESKQVQNHGHKLSSNVYKQLLTTNINYLKQMTTSHGIDMHTTNMVPKEKI